MNESKLSSKDRAAIKRVQRMIEEGTLVSAPEAGELSGTTRQNINKRVSRDTLEGYEIGGGTYIVRADLETAYK